MDSRAGEGDPVVRAVRVWCSSEFITPSPRIFLGGGLQVIVYVEDVNDEVPVFTQRQYNRLGLRETAGIGTSVAVVRATDRDTGRELGTGPKTPQGGLSLGGPAPVGCSVPIHRAPAPGNGGLVSYKILSGAEGKFEIDESTGLITTIDYLDYETKTSYLMNVSATDQAPPNNQGFCSVYVSLLNELDEAVQFSNSSYEAVIVENIPLGSEVLRVQARSIDNLNQITYKFDPNTNAQALALFKINGVTVSGLPQPVLPRLGWPPRALGEVVDVALRPRQGVITVKGQVDREKGDFYTLTVVADDGGPKVDSTVVSGFVFPFLPGFWECLKSSRCPPLPIRTSSAGFGRPYSNTLHFSNPHKQTVGSGNPDLGETLLLHEHGPLHFIFCILQRHISRNTRARTHETTVGFADLLPK